MNILDQINAKFSSPIYKADAAATSTPGVFKIAFSRTATPSVIDHHIYVTAKETETGLATGPA